MVMNAPGSRGTSSKVRAISLSCPAAHGNVAQQASATLTSTIIKARIIACKSACVEMAACRDRSPDALQKLQAGDNSLAGSAAAARRRAKVAGVAMRPRVQRLGLCPSAHAIAWRLRAPVRRSRLPAPMRLLDAPVRRVLPVRAALRSEERRVGKQGR